MQTFAKRTAPAALNPNDFKHELPPTKYGRHGKGSQAVANTAPTRLESSAQQEDHDFFGTDAGSIGDKTVESNEYADDVHDPQLADEPYMGSDGTEHGSDETDEDEEDQPSDVLLYRLNGQDLSVSRAEDPERYIKVTSLINKHKATLADPPSYPPTTSGEPSVFAQEDQEFLEERHDPSSGLVPNATGPIRTTQQSAVQEENQVQSEIRGVWQPALPAQNRYSQQQQAHQAPRPLPMQPKQQAAAYRDRNDTMQSQVHRSNAAGAEPKRPFNVVIVRGETQHRTGHTSSKDVELGMVTPTRTPKARAGAGAGAGAGTAVETNEETNVETSRSIPQLDYDEGELYEMDFAALQAKDYDVDPRSKSHAVHDLAGDDLNNEIAKHARDHSHREQQDFFASLDIDQWEQAGDWFQDQFAAMFQKFKDNRREKRKLSYEFEAKIAQRHQAVVKKRQLTDDALTAMKGAGALVLDTPKKMKQAR